MAAYYFRVPRYAGMPHLSTMLDSIGNDRAVAKLLGLSPRTIAKYRADGQAPRPVMYALFWETPWGTDLADCIAVNDARRAHGELSSWGSTPKSTKISECAFPHRSNSF